MPLNLEAQIDAGLIGYWQFEGDLVESSGTQAVAGTHDGTAFEDPLVNPLVYLPATDGPTPDFGQSVSFDGTNGITINGSNMTQTGYVNTFDDDINGAMSISF